MSGQTTGQVRKGHEFDVAVLSKYLRGCIPGLAEDVVVTQFNVGQSNPTFLLSTPSGKRYVMRKKPPGKLVATAHAIEREFRVLKALESSPVPVPRVYDLCEDSSLLGTPFYVMEFLKGRIFIDPWIPEIPKQDRRSCYLEMVRCLTLLHKVDYKALGLGDYGKPSQFYERQISRLHSVSQAQQSGEVPPLPKLSELLAWFSSNLPSAAISLIHGDYKLDNVVFHQQECRIIGMLDWELSTLGHPLSDLANMMILHYFPSTVSAPFKGLDGPNPVDSSSLQDSGIPSRMELLKYYCELTNRAFPPPEWTFCVAFALFKLSVIAQGVAYRASKGQASSAQAAVVGRAASVIANLAWKISQSGALDSGSKL